MQRVALFDIDNTIYGSQMLILMLQDAVLHGVIKAETFESIMNSLKRYKDGLATYDDTANFLLS